MAAKLLGSAIKTIEINVLSAAPVNVLMCVVIPSHINDNLISDFQSVHNKIAIVSLIVIININRPSAVPPASVAGSLLNMQGSLFALKLILIRFMLLSQ